jgi:hypothetical protein
MGPQWEAVPLPSILQCLRASPRSRHHPQPLQAGNKVPSQGTQIAIAPNLALISSPHQGRIEPVLDGLQQAAQLRRQHRVVGSTFHDRIGHQTAALGA